jgi:hypothetical protein
MKYLLMDRSSQENLLKTLAAMPAYLAAQFASLSESEAARPGPGNQFSPIEQCWHLADLEREGFGERMRRLRAEEKPALPDFDGEAIARERNYRAKSLADGLAAFCHAREENIAFIASIGAGEWSRDGVQEGVGPVALCDIPVMMSEHDAAHRAEIEAWRQP